MNIRQQHRQIVWYRLKRFLWKAVTVLFVFFITLNTLLQTETVQSYLAHQLSDYLSKQLNIRIEIEKVRVTLMMDVLLKDVRIDDAHQNQMITIKYFYARLNSAQLSKNIFRLSEAEMVEGELTIRKYEGERFFNITDLIGEPDTLREKSPELGFELYCRSARMTNCRFNLINENAAPRNDGLFDWNNMHLKISKVEARRLSVNEEEISVDFRNITVSDVSGFQVDKFTTLMRFADDGWYFDNTFLLTPKSTLDFDLKFGYTTFDNISEFVDSITLVADLRPSILAAGDLAYFAESLKDYPIVADVETKFHGTLLDFSLNDFKFQAGKNTNINMDARLRGILEPETAWMQVSLNNVTTSLSDIQQFNIPVNTSSLKPILFESFSTSAFFEGTVNQFKTEALIQTETGTITAQLNMEHSDIIHDYQYHGVIHGADLHVGSIAGISPAILGKCSFNLSFDGSGLSLNTANVNMRLTMDSLNVKSYPYKNIQVDGKLVDKQFDGMVSIDDKNVKFNFEGIVNFKNPLPRFDFKANLQNAYLSKLHLFPKLKKDFHLSSKIQIVATGYSVDNIRGRISISDFTMIESDSIYTFKGLNVITYNDTTTNERNIKVRSDLLDANLSGNFQLTDLGHAFTQFFGSYVASIHAKDSVASNAFELSYSMLCDIQLKNFSPITRYFMPELQIPDGLTASQTIDFEGNIMHTKCNAPTIIYNGIRGTDFYLDAATHPYGTTSDLGFSKISIIEKGDSTVFGVEDFNINALVKDDSIMYSISWDRMLDHEVDISYLDGQVSFVNYPDITLAFTDMSIVLQDGEQAWHVEPDNIVVFDSTGISVHHLKFYSDNPYIVLDGTVNRTASSLLSMKLAQGNLSSLNKILNLSGINTYGSVSGNVFLHNPYNHLLVSADLAIDNWKVNENELGDASMHLKWDIKEPSIFVDLNSVLSQSRGDVYPISINGHYYPDNPNKNFDLKIKLENIGLNAFAPYLKDYVTNVKGYISGEMTATGTQNDPQINGIFTVQRGMARALYTGVLYTMGGNIVANNKAFTFQDFAISDSMANQATLEGGVQHKGFQNFNLDLSLKPKNFTLFNIKDVNNDIFYGSIKSTGSINVTGTFDNIKINANVSTDKGTEITIPLNTAESVETSSFVIFTQPVDSTQKTTPPAVFSSTGLDLSLNVDVTSDGIIHIFLPGDAGKISATGNGNLLLRLDESNDFKLYGTYTIQKGDFNLTLQQLNITFINKMLTINNGSSIQFGGNPLDATMNVSATYTVQSSLEALNLPLDSSKTQRRIPVNCIIHMREKLSDPEIYFSIEFPSLHDEELKSNIYAKIDTSNVAEMTRQAFSLLLFGTFTSDEYSGSAGSMVGSASISMLTGQINNWLSHVVKGVDIGVNYRGSDQVTTDDFDVFLRKGMFNDRVVIDANVGKTTDNTTQSSSAAIDASIDVKITPDGRWRFKAFNRSNANDISKKSNEYGYTYGVGASYNRSFNRILDMFDNDRRKLRKEKKEGKGN